MDFRYAPPVKGIIASVKDLKKEKIKDKIDKEEGGQLYKEDIIQSLLDELERRKKDRAPFELQWMLNSNFLVGNQFCDINTYSNQIEQQDAPYDWLERGVYNQIAPLVETRIANLKKISYLMKVNPATNELEDYSKAEVSTNVLQYYQKFSNFKSKNDTAIAWNETCGNCFWLSWWDPNKGEKYAEVDETTIDKDGNERKTKTALYQGDLDYGLITPYEIYPDDVYKQTIKEQRSIMLVQVKSAEEIYDLYGIEVEGSAVDTFELTPIASGGGFGYESTVMSLGHRTVENSEKVITYFERPSRKNPNGKMIILIGETELVYYGDLPYSRIPITQMVCREVAGQFFGKSAIENLIPLQRQFNSCVNRIHEFVKRVAIGNIAVEEGSIDIEEYEGNGLEPGKLLVYKEGFQAPIPVSYGNLPPEVMNERYNLKNDMEYAAGVSQLMVNGATPSGITSGTAISNLMEIDNTRLSLTGDHIRNAIRELAITWLEILKRHAVTKRIVNYVGSNSIAKVLIWSNNEINSFDVDYITENELLMSEEMQKQRFFEAFNLGLFTDSEGKIPERVKQRALEFMKIGNYSDIMNINLLHMQAAQRENVFFEEGVVPKISEYDDHSIHIEEHLRYALQMDFHILKMKKPEYAAILEKHINEHNAAIEQETTKKIFNQIPGAIPPQM